MSPRKYKIVEVRQGGEIAYYELWLEHEFLWFSRWRAVETIGYRSCVTRRFTDLAEVQDYINSFNVTREIIQTGVLHD